MFYCHHIASGTNKLIYILVLFVSVTAWSQKSDVVFRTVAKHDYVIGRTYYLENNIDTNRLLLMGAIQITSSSQDLFLSRALNLLEMKTKELNGNAFKLRSHSIADTTLNLVFNVYFMSESISELNKLSKVKGRSYVFNTIKDTMYRQIYVNGAAYNFRRDKYTELLTSGKKLTLRLDTAGHLSSLALTHKTNSTALFFTVKVLQFSELENEFKIGSTSYSLIGDHRSSALTLRYRPVDTRYEVIYQLDYNAGRLMMDLYNKDNTIDVTDIPSSRK